MFITFLELPRFNLLKSTYLFCWKKLDNNFIYFNQSKQKSMIAELMESALPTIHLQ